MRKPFTILATACLVLLAHVAPLAADEKLFEQRLEALERVDSVPPGLFILWGQIAGTGYTTETIKQKLMARFRSNDVDGEAGISAADRSLLIDRQAAKIRAIHIQKWLLNDLDGDLVVTPAELRVGLVPGAYKPLRASGLDILPTRGQAEAIIAAKITKKMRIDLDNDGVVSFAEILDSAAAILEGTPNLDPQARMLPPPALDFDGDGIVSDKEMEIGIIKLFELADRDGNGRISADESNQTKRLARKPKPGTALRYMMDVLRKRRSCALPRPDQGTITAMISGHEGSGMSNIHFGDTGTSVKVADLVIARDGPPIFLVASFENSVVLRVNDPAKRLRRVFITSGEVALTGDGKVTPERVHSDCHIQGWKRFTSDNPNPRVFFEERFGRPPKYVVSSYTLGTVNLRAESNETGERLPGAKEAPMQADAAHAWARFELFNPGGLISIELDNVRSRLPVFTHEQPPQMAGIAQLLETGGLVRLKGGAARRQVTETGNGEIRLGERIFRPGDGDDSIRFEGLRYTEERPRIWIGREEDLYLATAPFNFPADLLGAHAVTILVPQGMETPSGNPGHSRIRKLDKDALVPEIVQE